MSDTPLPATTQGWSGDAGKRIAEKALPIAPAIVADLDSEVHELRQQLIGIADVWRSAMEHEGVVIECRGDDAAEAWNALCRHLDPLVKV